MIEEKTKNIDIELGDLIMTVNYTEHIEKFPMEIIEGHGMHLISHDDIQVTLTAVLIEIPYGPVINILPLMTYEQQNHIINNID